MLHANVDLMNPPERTEEELPVEAKARAKSLVRRSSVAILVHSRSGWQMKLHGLVLQSVLEGFGTPVRLVDENSDLMLSRELAVVVAPHEFWKFDLPRQYRKYSFRRNTIVYQTEQPETEWFRDSIASVLEARAVIDVSHVTRRLYSGAIPSIALTLPFDDAAMAKSGVIPSALSFSERPFDVCFFGQPNIFRDYALNFLVTGLENYNVKFSYYEMPRASAQSWAEFERFWETSRSSKIHLSISRSPKGFFTWDRIVVGGMGAGALALTARSSPVQYPKQGKHFLSTSAVQLPRVLEYLLSNPEGRKKAEELSSDGHDFARSNTLRAMATRNLKSLMRAVGM